MTTIRESCTHLAEKAIAADGTIGIKLIAPGWGSSGYYSAEVLERDIPRAFPAGTHLFWNHDTLAEESERPEGDLSRLAAVLTTDPVYEANGLAGPGSYARARVFGAFASDVDDLAENIGVSIRGQGVTHTGEVDGQTGMIVDEITHGRSVDFVTEAGAGGEITELFEAAGNGKLPETIQEAANVGEWLESRLHMRMTVIADDMFGEGVVNREERIAMSSAIGDALNSYRAALIASQPQLYQRRPFAGAPDSADVAALSTESARQAGPDLTEVNMTLESLQESLATAEATNLEQAASIARLQERELLREARDHVTAAMASVELPDVTKTRLIKTLAGNPLVAEGALDVEAFKIRIDAAVAEAQAEIVELLGQTGQITGQGDPPTPAGGGDVPELKESQDRIAAAMANAGYRGTAKLNGGTS